MDVMGEALEIDRALMLKLAHEADVSLDNANRLIDSVCQVASRFSSVAETSHPGAIRPETLADVQARIDACVQLLR